ncbi:predicted protein [Postia placenta Mad-698-R]|nr:predicted protein [Postia placenta Mad-698-R]
MTLSKEPFADTLVMFGLALGTDAHHSDRLIEAQTHAECSSAVEHDEQIALGLSCEEEGEWMFESSWGSLFDNTTLHPSTGEEGLPVGNELTATSSPIYIPPNTYPPMLCDNPRPWVSDATLAGPSTFAGALGYPGGTADGRHTHSNRESSHRIGDSVSYAIVPGLLYAEQDTTTTEYATTLHDEELQDSEDESDFENEASSLHQDAFTFGEDKEDSASIEDGPPSADEDVEVETGSQPIAPTADQRITHSQTSASSSSNITSAKQNDKGKERAKPEPPDEHDVQSSKNSKKRKNPHDGNDVDQPIPPKKKQTRRKVAKGNWECPEPGCTWTFTREWDMERHWEWDCSARDPSLLKVAICSYCDAQLSRPDALKRHLRDTLSKGETAGEGQKADEAERAGEEEEAGKAAEAVVEVAQLHDQIVYSVLTSSTFNYPTSSPHPLVATYLANNLMFCSSYPSISDVRKQSLNQLLSRLLWGPYLPADVPMWAQFLWLRPARVQGGRDLLQYAFITRLDEEGIKNVDMLVYISSNLSCPYMTFATVDVTPPWSVQWKEDALSDLKSVWVYIEVFKPRNQYIDDIPPEIPQLNYRAVVEIIRA